MFVCRTELQRPTHRVLRDTLTSVFFTNFFLFPFARRTSPRRRDSSQSTTETNFDLVIPVFLRLGQFTGFYFFEVSLSPFISAFVLIGGCYWFGFGFAFNPLTSRSDYLVNSFCNIHRLSSHQVTRILKLIRKKLLS